MKTRTKIIDVTHDDLVNLLSISLDELYVSYPKDFYKEHFDKEFGEEDSLEDKAARCLLANQPISIYDMQSEDSDDAYGTLPHEWDEDSQCMKYTLTLQDIVKGLENAFDGTFETNEGCEEDEIFMIHRCIVDYATEDIGFDFNEGYALMQVIVFGVIVYG